jgi:hypothetical protein
LGPNLQLPCAGVRYCYEAQKQRAHFGEVLAGRALGQRLVGVQERAGFSGLAGALTVELAGHV